MRTSHSDQVGTSWAKPFRFAAMRTTFYYHFWRLLEDDPEAVRPYVPGVAEALTKLAKLVPLCLLLFIGCTPGFSYVTIDDSPNMKWVDAIIKNTCNKVGIKARVVFADSQRIIPAEYWHADQDEPYCMGSQMPDTIWVYPICAEVSMDSALYYAKHECCHLLIGQNGSLDPEKNIALEEAAWDCVASTDWE